MQDGGLASKSALQAYPFANRASCILHREAARNSLNWRAHMNPSAASAARIAALVLSASPLICPTIARAQSAENTSEVDPISTGRPSFSGGTGTASVGRVIVENGFSQHARKRWRNHQRFSRNPDSHRHRSQFSELRLGVPNYLSARSSDSGFGDGSLGFRYRFYKSGHHDGFGDARFDFGSGQPAFRLAKP